MFQGTRFSDEPLFNQHQLTPILIKGAALCQSLYRDPALRPMRDIDILFHPGEVDAAQDLLRRAGYRQSTASIPPDHHHLPSLNKTVDGVQICIELHRGLYPDITPHYPEVDFSRLLETGNMIMVGEAEVVTFNHEETLHYLFQHGFRAPLTYETFKLINAADIISFIEAFYHDIDWKQIEGRFPQLYRALPLMHHISPWDSDRVSGNFSSEYIQKSKLQPIPFNGWPHRRRKEFKRGKVSMISIFKETFIPSTWWVRLYYGAGYSFYRYVKALCIDHPRNVFSWAKLYYRLNR